MAEQTRKTEGNKERHRGRKGKRRPAAAICSALGALALVLLILLCLPLTLPKAFGWHIYTVVSGSMEPEIPTGSLVYIQKAAPEEMGEGDVIAYYGASDPSAIITHRVVENRMLMGEFITKGDANPDKDLNPIPYDNFIGEVALTIPRVGEAAQMLTSTPGKAAAGCAVAAAIILQVMASFLDREKE